ncbi:flagellar biosynthesis regulator FlaF [Ruegeria marina]|uniref:Flagellar protein FlaF n=1 Tax=Ruegeria marina TaxID=639004 RepID=A0A1G6P095_9RHOB|nr:flagellar biosynthesis regulator FlaF [Ruegeria marina]SDC73418.1 flagellar protein FlaF [Ruegeria marina]
MNALLQARQAYSAASAPIRTPRNMEYQVLSRITHRMHSAAKRGSVGFGALVEALHDNNRFWSVLAAEVADGANGLPADLRARLFYLAEFTQVHTSKVLRREASVRPLLEINTAVLRGLRHGGSAT